MKFLLKLGFFLVPIVAILGLPLAALYRAGEFMPDSAIVARQTPATSTVIAGLAYTNPVDYLNLQLVIAKKPQVLILGSSQVGQIRSTFFHATTTIYDASGMQKIGQFNAFLNAIPATDTPQLIIIGLEHRFFNPNYDSGAPDNIDSLLTQPMTFLDVTANWQNVYADYFHHKFSLAGLLDPASSSIGFEAIVHGSGYRSDGTRDPGYTPSSPFNPAAPDYHYQSTLALINKGITGFEYSNTVSQTDLAALDAFLSACRARNIQVIGFMLPLAPTVYQTMVAEPNRYGYLAPLSADLVAEFKKYNFSYNDFGNPATLGITDDEMEDGLHTTERGSLKMFIAMAEQDLILRQYAEPDFLEAQLASSTGQFNIVQ